MNQSIDPRRAARAISECRLLAAMTEEPGRTTRRFLTGPVAAVHQHLRVKMEALGMRVTTDAAGNLRGVWNADAGTRLVIGSHIDTVPDAGGFDGVLGVVLALELVAFAQAAELPYAIEVIAFSEEEGVRFGVPFIGSRAVAGRFDPALLALTDADGLTLEAAIRNFGLDPAELEDSLISDEAMGFLEIHIEQGPVLEAEDLRVAVVTGMVGQTRCDVRFLGHANHAGTTPMNLRHDALAAGAEWILRVEQTACATDGLVATVGKLEVEPNAGSVIAGSVRASLDVRHADDTIRKEAVMQLQEQARAIADRRGVGCDIRTQMEQAAVPMDEELTAMLVDAVESVGFAGKTMPSGAGHDAMVMATRVPSAMLFLRSPGGISHHPDEAVVEEDVEAALRVAEVFLRRLCSRAG